MFPVLSYLWLLLFAVCSLTEIALQDTIQCQGEVELTCQLPYDTVFHFFLLDGREYCAGKPDTTRCKIRGHHLVLDVHVRTFTHISSCSAVRGIYGV